MNYLDTFKNEFASVQKVPKFWTLLVTFWTCVQSWDTFLVTFWTCVQTWDTVLVTFWTSFQIRHTHFGQVSKVWTHFGQVSKVCTLFGHILDMCPNFGYFLVTFWTHFGHFLSKMCPYSHRSRAPTERGANTRKTNLAKFRGHDSAPSLPRMHRFVRARNFASQYDPLLMGKKSHSTATARARLSLSKMHLRAQS